MGWWKTYGLSTKYCSCLYQTQRPSPIFTSKAVLKPKVKEWAKSYCTDFSWSKWDLKLQSSEQQCCIFKAAIIQGVDKLKSANVEAKDFRGGAALVAAALMAEGISSVSGIIYIKRGYEKLIEKLTILGAKIKEEW